MDTWNEKESEPEISYGQKIELVHQLRYWSDQQTLDFLDTIAASGWSGGYNFLPGGSKTQLFKVYCVMPNNLHDPYVDKKLICQNPQGRHEFCPDHQISNCPIDGTQLT